MPGSAIELLRKAHPALAASLARLGAMGVRVRAHLRVAHAGVGRELASGEAGELARAGGLHPGADDRRGFAGFVVLQLADGERGRFDVDVNAVEQRAE